MIDTCLSSGRVKQWLWVSCTIAAVTVASSAMVCIAPLVGALISSTPGDGPLGLPGYYAYFLAGAAGILVLGVSFVKPFWGLLVFMALLPFRSEQYALADIGGAVIRVADPVALFTFLGLLCGEILARRRRLPLRPVGVELPLLALLWWCCLSLVWCESYGSGFSKILQFAYGIVVFYMVLALVRTKRDLVAALWPWVLGGVLIGGTAFAAGLAGIGGGGGRAESLQTSAIETGEYLNYGILVGIGLFMVTRSKFAKGLAAGAVAVMLLGTLLGSASRGPLLGLAAGLVFLYFFCDRLRTCVHLSIPLVVVGSVGAFLVVGLFGDNLIELTAALFRRFIELAEDPAADPGVAYRLDIWGAIWQLYLQHPILGIGIGSLSELLPLYTQQAFRDPKLAHNMYLEVFIAVGPIGFLAFLCFLWRVARALLGRVRWRLDEGLHIVFVFLVATQVAKAVGCVTFGMFFEDRVEWTALALCFAAVLIMKEHGEAGRAVESGRTDRLASDQAPAGAPGEE